jgi:hypothetical protein
LGNINPSWANLNAERVYPLADAATALSLSGVRLPDAIIVDLNLRWPATLGAWAFIGSVTVTAQLVSVTFQVATDPDDVTTFQPLAAISLALNALTVNTPVLLQPQADGVGGWVVFGRNAADQLYSGRFTGYAASGLSPRAARAYTRGPVRSLGTLHMATALSGIVKLHGMAPLQVVTGQQEIDGILRTVGVVSLVEPAASAATASVVSTSSSIFSTYAGPCGGRPESQTCTDPAPLESLNTVQPDCDGNITVVFQGCGKISAVKDSSGQTRGIAVDCGIGLGTTCVPDTLPTSEGVLANEYNDPCAYSLTTPAAPAVTAPAATMAVPACVTLIGGHSYTYQTTGQISAGSTAGALPACTFISDGTSPTGAVCGNFAGTAATGFEAPNLAFGTLVGRYNCGCTACGTFTWNTGQRKEWNLGGGKAAVWYSPPAMICVDGVESISLSGSSDDWVGLIGTNDTVQESWDEGITENSPQSFVIPASTIFLQDTVGHTISKIDHTVQKTWTDGPHTYVYPSGDAYGRAGGSVDWMLSAGFTVIDWGAPVLVSALRSRGWVNANNVLYFRVFHVPGGVGGVNIDAVTCQSPGLVDAKTVFKLGTSGSLSVAASTTLSVMVNGGTSVPVQGSYTFILTDTTTSETTEYPVGAATGITETTAVLTGTTSGPGAVMTVSENLSLTGELPYTQNFGTDPTPYFQIISGQFDYVTDDSGGGTPDCILSLSSETARGPAQRNIALWTGFDHTTLSRQYTVDLKLVPGSPQSNGGLIINYNTASDFSGRQVYYLFLVDYATQQVGFWYFNGSTLQPTTATAQLVNLQQNTWYSLKVTTSPSGDSVTLTGTLEVVGDSPLTVVTLATSSYLPATGNVGIYADRSFSRFGYFTAAAL